MNNQELSKFLLYLHKERNIVMKNINTTISEWNCVGNNPSMGEIQLFKISVKKIQLIPPNPKYIKYWDIYGATVAQTIAHLTINPADAFGPWFNFS